ncbi:MAG: hypothetical protein ABI868_21235 [Acidobacteriota bacterium]
MSVITAEQRIYWHRDLPPLAAEVLGEHTGEAWLQGRFTYMLYR